jgi:hypothetical protein
MACVRVSIIVSLFLFSSACTDVGNDFSVEQIQSYERGVAKYDQVIADLGPPTGTGVDEDGNKTIYYGRSSGGVGPVGLVRGFESKTAILTFDENDILIAVQSSQTGESNF